MNTRYVHPTTQKLLDAMATKLPQSILLTGPKGIGLATIATEFASQFTKTPIWVLPEKDQKVDLEKGSVTIDSIRKLYDQTRAKAVSRQVIIIDYAERMTAQAQNAFLKLLEEPNQSVHFIMLSHSLDPLLPTVLSRVQKLEFRPITPTQTASLLKELGVTDTMRIQQLTYMAGGLPAELTRLVTDAERFEARASIFRDARTLLQGATYDGLRVAQRYANTRPEALALVQDASTILVRSLQTTGDVQQSAIAKLDALEKARGRIAANGSIKLVLAALVV